MGLMQRALVAHDGDAEGWVAAGLRVVLSSAWLGRRGLMQRALVAHDGEDCSTTVGCTWYLPYLETPRN